METKQFDFLLGALSPSGFCGYYAQLVQDLSSNSTTLIKGGPGCGKSTMLRRFAQHLLEQGETVELIHCAGDPSSLDAVVCKARKLYIADATPPHAMEPNYPIAFENIISLYSALDRNALCVNRNEIITLYSRNKNLTERATRYVTAAGSLLQDTAHTVQCCTDLEKARAFGLSLSRRYLQATDTVASEDLRLLSAITCEGFTFYKQTITAAADTIVVLEDAYGCAGKAVLQALRTDALEKGHAIITCYCPLSPYEKIEHIFIPALRLAFVTSNDYHPVRLPGCRTVHCTRFCNSDGLSLRKKRIRFNHKAVVELLGQASALLAEAKACHDTLEAYYTDATDFSLIDKIRMPE